MDGSVAPSLTVPLAITGMACRLPGGDGLEAYWNLIQSGRSAIGTLPEDRFPRSLYFDPERGHPASSYSEIGATVSLERSRQGTYRLSADQILQADPAHRVLLDVAADALTDAGLDADQTVGVRAGVYVGHTRGTCHAADMMYATMLGESAELLRDVPELTSALATAPDPDGLLGHLIAGVTGEMRASLPRRTPGGSPLIEAWQASRLVSAAFGLDGPYVSLNAACASSLMALALAGNALALGQIDMALVGGTSFIAYDGMVLFSRAGSVSATGSRPFDEGADGLVAAEGYAVVTVKTLAKALADGDRIHAVVRGIGLSSDGRGKSTWAPRKEGQVEAIRRAYAGEASPMSLQYLEAHATSTQLGDATEVTALAEVLGPALPSGTRLPIGSVKGNIGHTLETAGLAGLIKTILAMRHRTIPPTIGVTQPSARIDWSNVPFRLPQVCEPWPEPAPGQARRAGVNAFGIGGLNAHVVIDEFDPVLAPSWVPDTASDRFAASRTEATASARTGSHGQKGRSNDNASVRPATVTRRTTFEPLAVVGVGSVLPGAFTAEAFWNLATSGRSAISDVTDRWNPRLSHDPDGGAYTSPTTRGGFLTDWTYDWRRHKVPPRQVETADPLQFLLLEAVDQALTDSGLRDRPSFNRMTTGVVVGTIFGGDFGAELQMGLRLPEFEVVLSRHLTALGFPEAMRQSIVRQYRDVLLKKQPALFDETASFTSSTLASRITKSFDLMGGAVAIDSGDASSLIAVELAAQMLQTGRTDAMIVACGQRSLGLAMYESLAHRGVLAIEGTAQPLDLTSPGLIPGEGAAVVILRRLADAVRDGDSIRAVVRSLSSRRADQLSRSVATAATDSLTAAELASDDLSLVEMTAPGAARYDRDETDGWRVGLSASERATNVNPYERRPVPVATIAGQIGHTAGAAGLVSFVKATHELDHVVGAMAGSPNMPLDGLSGSESSLRVMTPAEPLAVRRDDGRLFAAVSNINPPDLAVVAILERATPVPTDTTRIVQRTDGPHSIVTKTAVANTPETNTHEPKRAYGAAAVPARSIEELPSRWRRLIVTAASPSQLVQACEAVADAGAAAWSHVRSCDEACVAFPSETGAALAIVADSPDRLAERARQTADALRAGGASDRLLRSGAILWEPHPMGQSPSIAFLFPGQGSQSPGMLESLLSVSAAARAWKSGAEAVLAHHGLPTWDILTAPRPDGTPLGVAETQLAMFLGNGVAWAAIAEAGIAPDVVAGHSFGEYTALMAAGVWSFDQALWAASVRAHLVETHTSVGGRLVSLQADLATTTRLLESVPGPHWISHTNAPLQTVVGGPAAVVEAVADAANRGNLKPTILAVPRAFHTPLMEAVVPPLAQAMRELTLAPPAVRFVSSVTHRELSDPEAIRDSLARQLTAPVAWVEVIATLVGQGVRLMIEVGPGSVLTGLTNRCLADVSGVDAADVNVPGADVPGPSVSRGSVLCLATDAKRGDAAERLALIQTASQLIRTPSARPAPIVVTTSSPPKRAVTAPLSEGPLPTTNSVAVSASRLAVQGKPKQIGAVWGRAWREALHRATHALASRPEESDLASDGRVSRHSSMDLWSEELTAAAAESGVDPRTLAALGRRFDGLIATRLVTLAVPAFRHGNGPFHGFALETDPSEPLAFATSPRWLVRTATDGKPVATLVWPGQPTGPIAVAASGLMVTAQPLWPSDLPVRRMESDGGRSSALVPPFAQAATAGRIAADLAWLIASEANTTQNAMAILDELLPNGTVTPPNRSSRFDGVAMGILLSDGRPGSEILYVETNGFETTSRTVDGIWIVAGDSHFFPLSVSTSSAGPGAVPSCSPGEATRLDSPPRDRTLYERGERMRNAIERITPAHRSAEAVRDRLIGMMSGERCRVAFLAGTAARTSTARVSAEDDGIRRPVAETIFSDAPDGGPHQVVGTLGELFDSQGHPPVADVSRMHDRRAFQAEAQPTEAAPPAEPSLEARVPHTAELILSAAEFASVTRSANAAAVLADATGQTPPSPPGEATENICERFAIRLVESPVVPDCATSARLPARTDAPRALVLGDNAVGRALADRLLTLGMTVTTVAAPAARVLSSDDAERVLTDLVQSVTAACDREVPPHLFLVTAWDEDALPTDGSTDSASDAPTPRSEDEGASRFLDRWRQRRVTGVRLPHRAVKTWYERLAATKRAASGSLTTAAPACGLEAGVMAGLAKAMALEVGLETAFAFRARAVESDSSMRAADVAERIVTEWMADHRDTEVRYQGGRRLVPRPVPIRLVARQPISPLAKTYDGVWIVTGGARGVTAEVVATLGPGTSATWVLVGSSPLPTVDRAWHDLDADGLAALRTEVMRRAVAEKRIPAEAWGAIERGLEIDRNLARLAALGINVVYRPCDLGDADAVAGMLASVRKLGPIRGIVHGAGFEKAARLTKKKDVLVDRTFAAKLDAAVHLLTLTAGDELRAFVGFGSISGRFGSVGQTDYASANAGLARLASLAEQLRPGLPVTTIDWHSWDDVGMAVRPETKYAKELAHIRLMPAVEGGAHLAAELASGLPEPEIVITDWRYFKTYYPDTNADHQGHETEDMAHPGGSSSTASISAGSFSTEPISSDSAAIASPGLAASSGMSPLDGSSLAAVRPVAASEALVFRAVTTPLDASAVLGAGVTMAPIVTPETIVSVLGPTIVFGAGPLAETLATMLRRAGVAVTVIRDADTWQDRRHATAHASARSLFVVVGLDAPSDAIHSTREFAEGYEAFVRRPVAVVRQWLDEIQPTASRPVTVVGLSATGGALGTEAVMANPLSGLTTLALGTMIDCYHGRPTDDLGWPIAAPHHGISGAQGALDSVRWLGLDLGSDVSGTVAAEQAITLAIHGRSFHPVALTRDGWRGFQTEHLPLAGTGSTDARRDAILPAGSIVVAFVDSVALALVMTTAARRAGWTLHLVMPEVGEQTFSLDGGPVEAPIIRHPWDPARPDDAGRWLDQIRDESERIDGVVLAVGWTDMVSDTASPATPVARVSRSGDPAPPTARPRVPAATMLTATIARRTLGDRLRLFARLLPDAILPSETAERGETDSARICASARTVRPILESHLLGVYEAPLMSALAAERPGLAVRTVLGSLHAGSAALGACLADAWTGWSFERSRSDAPRGTVGGVGEGNLQSLVLIPRQSLDAFDRGDVGGGPIRLSGNVRDDVSRMPLIDLVAEQSDHHFVGETRLDPIRDVFLAQHRLRDRPLLPLVGAMEILAQAGELQGAPGHHVVELSDVVVTDAIRLMRDSVQPLRVRLTALTGGDKIAGPSSNRTGDLETADKELALAYDGRLTTDLIDRQGRLIRADRPHVQATVRLASERTPPPIPRPSVPPRGFWGDAWYFEHQESIYHGPAFRTLRQVSFSPTGLYARLVAPPRSILGGPRLGEGFVLPAALIDGVLFACGVYMWAKQGGAVLIPRAIGRIVLGSAPREGEHCVAAMTYHGRDGDDGLFDAVVFDQAGRVVVSIYHYRCVELIRGGDASAPRTEATRTTTTGPTPPPVAARLDAPAPLKDPT